MLLAALYRHKRIKKLLHISDAGLRVIISIPKHSVCAYLAVALDSFSWHYKDKSYTHLP